MIAASTLDNLGRATQSEVYADEDNDFAADEEELRGRGDALHDELGRVYRSLVYEVDSAGNLGDHLTANNWYNARGMLIKSADANGLFQKGQYDGAGRMVAWFVSFDTDETAYGDADDVSGDTVIEQGKTIFDPGSRVVTSLAYQRWDDDTTSTGELTAANSYATGSVFWYDKADRPTHSANYGHEQGTTGTRYLFNTSSQLIDTDADGIPDLAEASPPTSYSDDYILGQVQYNPAGLQYRSIDNKGHITETQFDLLARPTKVIENYANGVASETESDTDRVTVHQYDSAGRTWKLIAYNPKGTSVEQQTTTYLYESTHNGSWNTNVIYPDSSDTDGPYLSVTGIAWASGVATVTTAAEHGYAEGAWVRIVGANEAGFNGWFQVASATTYTFTYTIASGVPAAATGTITVKRLGTDQVRMTYDRLGRTLTSRDQRGVVHSYSFDPAGRLSADAVTELPAGVNGGVRRIECGYDDLGRVKLLTSYDAASGGTVRNEIMYAYDAWGNGVRSANHTIVTGLDGMRVAEGAPRCASALLALEWDRAFRQR